MTDPEAPPPERPPPEYDPGATPIEEPDDDPVFDPGDDRPYETLPAACPYFAIYL